jgi:hypothetical protein
MPKLLFAALLLLASRCDECQCNEQNTVTLRGYLLEIHCADIQREPSLRIIHGKGCLGRQSDDLSFQIFDLRTRRYWQIDRWANEALMPWAVMLESRVNVLISIRGFADEKHKLIFPCGLRPVGTYE